MECAVCELDRNPCPSRARRSLCCNGITSPVQTTHLSTSPLHHFTNHQSPNRPITHYTHDPLTTCPVLAVRLKREYGLHELRLALDSGRARLEAVHGAVKRGSYLHSPTVWPCRGILLFPGCLRGAPNPVGSRSSPERHPHPRAGPTDPTGK